MAQEQHAFDTLASEVRVPVGRGCTGQSRLLRKRLLPRLLEADSAGIVNETGPNPHPFRMQGTLMRNEKLTGHGEHSLAISVIDMAV
jgi:hypothetical protein